MTDRSFERANRESRARLAALVATLTPERLAVDLGGGWTVASAIGHVGFWDRWQALRWRKMLDGAWTGDSGSLIEAEHLANDALEPYWAGATASDLPGLALEAATRLDDLIARASDAQVVAIEGTPSAFLLHRHRHRGEHLDHIERGLEAAGQGRAPAQPAADRSYLDLNESSRARLRELVGRLTPADLALEGGEQDWTVGQILCHMAFWDRFLAARWRAALVQGPGAQPLWFQHEIPDLLNDALPAQWAAFASAAPDAVMAEVLAAAEEVDRLIAGLPEATPFPAILSERRSLLDRSIHRSEHLQTLVRVL